MGKRRKSLEVRICKLEELQQTIRDLKKDYYCLPNEIEVKELKIYGLVNQ